MYPKHNTSKHKFLILPTNASFSAFPFRLISTPLFQLLRAEILKYHPKENTICSILFPLVLRWKYTQPKSYFSLLLFPLIATFLILTIILFSWINILLLFSLLLPLPYKHILCSEFLNVHKIISLLFPKVLQIPSHSEENVKGVNRNYKSLKYQFSVLALPLWCLLLANSLPCVLYISHVDLLAVPPSLRASGAWKSVWEEFPPDICVIYVLISFTSLFKCPPTRESFLENI